MRKKKFIYAALALLILGFAACSQEEDFAPQGGGEQELRILIDIANGTITGTMPRRALKMVYDWLDLHQEELMDNWRRLQCGEEFKKIAPLE